MQVHFTGMHSADGIDQVGGRGAFALAATCAGRRVRCGVQVVVELDERVIGQVREDIDVALVAG